MTYLSDLFSLDDLDREISEKNVRVRPHPTLPLRVFNYTEQCQWAKSWNPVTLKCRGLIAHDNGIVVARSWDKYFNYGEGCEPNMPPPDLDLDAEVEVTDKIDGSLGILYPTKDGYAIATRGSFESEQAKWATDFFRKNYPHFYPNPNYTYLVEIVYKANRIVLDYGDFEGLIHLGAVRISDGRAFGPSDNWHGPKTEVFHYRTLRDALEAAPRTNAEGFVVRYVDSGLMVKIKQEDYRRLHAIISKLSARSIWEALAIGESIETIVAPLPDEFHKWATATAIDLLSEYNEYCLAAQDVFVRIPKDDRKTFAIQVVGTPYAAALFNMLDGRDWLDLAWKSCKPEFIPYKPMEEV